MFPHCSLPVWIFFAVRSFALLGPLDLARSLSFSLATSRLRRRRLCLTRYANADSVAVYEVVCKETSTGVDSGLLARMKAANEARLKEIEDAIKDAIENEGDMEVRDATMAKAQILARTADKATAIAGYEEAEK